MAVDAVVPSTVKNKTEYNFISSFDASDLAHGIHKPQVDSELVRRYGRQDLTGFMEMMGNKELVKGIEINHYEKDRIHSVVKFQASTATGEASKTLTVATAYGYTYSSNQSPYIATGSTTVYTPRKYDVVEFPDGTEGQVTAVSGSSVTILPTNASVLPAVAASNEIIIKGNAMNEGSSAVESRNSRMLSFTNYIQTVRDDHEVTNREAGVETWLELGYNGQTGYVWYLEALADTYHRFMNEREVQLLTGQKVTNTALANTAGFETVTKTEGLIPQIENGGNVETYSTFDMTDIENMVLALNKFRGSRENFLPCGINLSLDIDELFRGEVTSGGFDAAKNGGILFNSFNGDDAQSVNFEFDAFKYGGYRFAKKVLDIFSEPTLLGATGHKYKDLGIVIPMDNTVVYNNMNEASSTNVPSITMMYTEDADGSREKREWVTGYGMGARTTGDDKFQVHYLSDFGLRVAALNRFGLFKKSS